MVRSILASRLLPHAEARTGAFLNRRRGDAHAREHRGGASPSTEYGEMRRVERKHCADAPDSMAELGRYGDKQHRDHDNERMERVLLRELAYWRWFLRHDTNSPVSLRQLVMG
jgi:hypothetical protein